MPIEVRYVFFEDYVIKALHWVPIPCPWFLGGHGCYIIVHRWAWVGVGGHRSLLMGVVWVWVQI